MPATAWSEDEHFVDLYNKYYAMTPAQRDAFKEALKESVGEKDTNSLLMLFSLRRMFMDAEYYEAMKEAVKEAVVENIFGK